MNQIEEAKQNTPGNVINIADARPKASSAAEGRTRRPRADEMVREFLDLLKSECDPESFFHTPDREPFAHIKIGDHYENWPLASTGFTSWVDHAFYKVMGIPPDEKTLKLLMRQFAGKAKYEGREIDVAVRVAELADKLYVDLCDSRWRAVEISDSGWKVVDDPPVRFRRSPGMHSLPIPEKGGDVKELLAFLNLATRDDQVLALAWIVFSFFGSMAHPILALHGTAGSGKTTAAALFGKLIDPSKAPLRSAPRDERDLSISARHSYLLAFDNLSGVPDWLSDAFCRLVTGSGFATRKLYTNEEQQIFAARRPILLNGIEDLASRGDLLDRTVLLRLPAIKKTGRRPEREFWIEFEQASGRIVGALFGVAAIVLRDLPKVKLSEPPRMADFARIGCAAELALGFEEGSFIEAYRNNRAEASLSALEASPAAVEIPRMLAGRTKRLWEGSAGDLLAELNRSVGEEVRRDRFWPRSARAMASVLDRAKLNLEHVGIRTERLPREGGTGRRIFRLSFVTSSQ